MLRECQALATLFPELDNLFVVAQKPHCEAKMDLGINTLDALKQIAQLTDELDVRFAVLCHNFGKIMATPKQCLHDANQRQTGVRLIDDLCERLKVPNQYKKIAQLVCRYVEQVHHIEQLSSTEIVELLNYIDVWRNPTHLEKLILSSLATYSSIKNNCDKANFQVEYLRNAYFIAKSISIQEIIQAGIQGKAIQKELMNRRINALDDWKNTNF